MTEVNTSLNIQVTEENGQQIVTTATNCDSKNGVTGCTLSKELGEISKDEQENGLVTKTVIECEKTEETNEGTTQKIVESHMESIKATLKDGGAVTTTTTTQIKETSETIVTSVNEKLNEANDKVKEVKASVDAGKEKIEEEVTTVKNEAVKVKDEAVKSGNNLKAEASKVKDEAVKSVNNAKTTVDDLQKPSRQFVDVENTSKIPISMTIGEHEEALHALNKLRSMHNVEPLQWDEALEKNAKTWALKMAEMGINAELSGIENLGELVFVAKGTSECSRMIHAILEWYKPISQYKFINASMLPVSDKERTFTQLVWDKTTHVGMCAMYREDKRISYIVANFSPAGNYGDVRNYLEHVKKPVSGLPPKIPKLEDLVQQNDSPVSNMASMFGVLCNWCVSFEEKPEIKVVAARPIMKVSASSDHDLSSQAKE